MLDQAFNEYVKTVEPPLGLVLPPNIIEIYDALRASEENAGRTCEGGFFYGGLFISRLQGKKERDVDMVVCAAELVSQHRQYQELNTKPYGSYRAMEDSVEQLGALRHQIFRSSGSIFYTDEHATPVKNDPVLGDYFAMTAYYETTSASRQLDILFTERLLEPQVFFAGYNNGPISQIAYDAEDSEYVYHRDFPRHAQEWLFQPDITRPIPENALATARRKGMQIVIEEPVCPAL